MLITGSSGALGRDLVKVFPTSFHPSHGVLDIIDGESVSSYVKKHKPSCVIHAAAIVGVRECEDNKDLAWRTNVEGTRNLVAAAMKYVPDVRFVYLSTACVFDGKTGFYSESSIPVPENFYGLTKLVGEFVASELPNHMIIRTNFVPRKPWKYPRAFIDRFGTYLFTDQVAPAIDEVLRSKLTGVVHVVGDTKLSMFDLAKIVTPNIEPMSLNEYTGPPLTVDMTLRSDFWHTYKLGAPAVA